MITYDSITGNIINKTWNSTTREYDVVELSEQEINALNNKPKFTSMSTVDDDDDDKSFLTDVGRVGFSTLEGFAQLGSDVLIRPFQEDKEEYDEAYSEWRADVAEYVPGLDREDIIDPETGEVLRPETGAGKVLDVGTYLVGGGLVFKALGKLSKLQKASMTKGVLSEQVVEQVLADPDHNLFNFVAEDLMEEPPAVIEFLAADEDDDVLFNRAKTALSSGILTAGVGGLLNLGFKAIDISKHSQKVLGKEMPDTPEEVDALAGSLLAAVKKGEELDPSKIVNKLKKVTEDDAEGVAQIINQSSGRLKGYKSKVMGTLKWTEQRWLKSRGFYSKKAYEASQETIHRQKQLLSHTNHLANRLQRAMDNVVEGNIADDVTEALVDKKMLNLNFEDKIKYLTDTNMESFLTTRYGFSNEIASRFLKVNIDDRVNFLKRNGFSDEAASEIATTKPYGFSEDIAYEIADARGSIDSLSKTLLDSNIGSEVVREAIAENLGGYVRRSYRLYEDGNWRPTASLIERAEKAIVDAKIGKRKNVSDAEVNEFHKDAKDYVKDLLDETDINNYDDYLSKIRRVNTQYLSQRKEILPEIRELMGEIKDPSENIILTIQKLTSITENNKFYNKLMELGGSVPSNPTVYDNALAQARRELRDPQINLLDDTVEELKKGSYVTLNNAIGDVPAGTVGRVVNVGTKRTPNRTFVRVSGAEKPLSLPTEKNSMNLSVIANNQKVNKLTKQYYDDATGGNAYTDTKYISEHSSDIFDTKISGTGSALDGQYTTPELARAINNLEDTHVSIFGLGKDKFKKGLKSGPMWQYYVGAKGLNQQMRTVYDHTTHLRNGLGGYQFGLANGLNPLKNGRLNFQVLKNEIGGGGDKVFDALYERLQGLGVVNTSVRASEARALLDIASETRPSKWVEQIEKYSKKYPETNLGKLAKAARVTKEMPEQVYMATDDFFKMNAFGNELATLRRAHKGDPKWTEELLELEAAQLIKDTFPNYDKVFKGVKALREMPVGNFVAFPAEIARTSAHIVAQGVKEATSGNPVLMKRGLQRLAGFTTLNAGWFVAGQAGYRAFGFSEVENEGIQTNAEKSFSLNHNKQIFRSKDGEFYVHDPTYLNSYAIWQDMALDVYRELSVGKVSGKDFSERMGNATMKSLSTFIEPFVDEAMFTELMGDLFYAMKDEQGRTSQGKQIFEDKDNYGESIYDAVAHIAEGFAPGVILDLNKFGEAIFETPNPTTGLKKSLSARTIEMLSGINFRKYSPEDNFMFHTKKYNRIVNYEIPKIRPRYGKEGEDYFKTYSVGQAKKYEAAQEMYRQVKAMRDIGWRDGDIYKLMGEAGFRGKTARKFIMKGRFRPDTISRTRKRAMVERAGDKEQAKQDNRKLQEFYNFINGLLLHPVEDEDLFGSGIVSDKISLGKFERSGFAAGGLGVLSEDNPVPKAPQEPDERIDKLTGMPYNQQAGEAFVDNEDPLVRLGFTGGGSVDPLRRLGSTGGGSVDPLVRLGFARGSEVPEVDSGDDILLNKLRENAFKRLNIKDREEAKKQLKFVNDVIGYAESKDDYKAINENPDPKKRTTASGRYQFLDSAVVTAANRILNTLLRIDKFRPDIKDETDETGQKVKAAALRAMKYKNLPREEQLRYAPEWLLEAAEGNTRALNLSPERQQIIFEGDMFEREGSDELVEKMLKGDEPALTEYYNTKHHTDPKGQPNTKENWERSLQYVKDRLSEEVDRQSKTTGGRIYNALRNSNSPIEPLISGTILKSLSNNMRYKRAV